MTTAIPRLAPRPGWPGAAGQVWATLQAEIIMQWRRLGFWLTFGGAAALLLIITVPAGFFLLHLPANSLYAVNHYTPTDLQNLMTFNTTSYGAMLCGLLMGLLVADRIDRDRRLNMREVQAATTLGWGRYILGKYLGNILAVLLPALAIYLLCGLVTVILGWPALLVAKFTLAFAVALVPGAVTVVGVILLLSSFLPLRVVQLAFSLLWIEINIGLGWRELGYTLLNPSGLYSYPVFFPVPPMQYTLPGFQTSLALALLNVVVLLVTGLAAAILAYMSLLLQQYRAERA